MTQEELLKCFSLLDELELELRRDMGKYMRECEQRYRAATRIHIEQMKKRLTRKDLQGVKHDKRN